VLQEDNISRYQRYLYPPPQLCYNPDIEHTTSFPDKSSLDSSARTPAHAPVPAYDQQGKHFAVALELLTQGVSQHVFPAASAAVTFKGELVLLKSCGRFTYDQDSPEVTPASIFDLASLTKVLATTSMAMLLYERGVLDLDMPAINLVPQLRTNDARRELITVGMLLAHSSGLPAYEKLFLRANGRDEIIAAACATPLVAEPGSRTTYSDIGFIILGLAVEALAGETLDRFCGKEIFGPLGMAHTGFDPPVHWWSFVPPTQDDPVRDRIIQGEVQDENANAMDGVAAHAGLFSSVEDLSIFANVMLQGGRPILRPETLELFTKRQSSPDATSQAMGWDTPSSSSQSGRYFSARSFGHLGYTGTSLWVDPERQLSITLLTNRTWPDCKNEAIKQFRPKFHDAVVEALENNR
jgi:serine-type D-Ala-D-Ala carboxypeptidase